MEGKKEYVLLIASSVFADNDDEAKRIAYKQAQYLRLAKEFDGNEAGIYRLMDVSADSINDWRRVIDN